MTLDATYRLDKDIDVAAWLRLYHCSGWNQDWTVSNAEAMRRHAYLIITAWLGDEIVGTLTVLGDGVNYATIEDVVVQSTVCAASGRASHGWQSNSWATLNPIWKRSRAWRRSTRCGGFVLNGGHTAMLWRSNQPSR